MQRSPTVGRCESSRLRFATTSTNESGKHRRTSVATLPDLRGDDLERFATDPYRLDFLRLDPAATERQLETALVDRIGEFLMHLGRGFAYLGRQSRLTIGDSDFFPDLLFYNTHLHAYVVFELKTRPFLPAHAGQLAFYVTAIEREIRAGRASTHNSSHKTRPDRRPLGCTSRPTPACADAAVWCSCCRQFVRVVTSKPENMPTAP